MTSSPGGRSSRSGAAGGGGDHSSQDTSFAEPPVAGAWPLYEGPSPTVHDGFKPIQVCSKLLVAWPGLLRWVARCSACAFPRVQGLCRGRAWHAHGDIRQSLMLVPLPGAAFLYGRPVGGVAATMPRLLLQHALDSSLPGSGALPHANPEGLDTHCGPDLSLLGWPSAPARAHAGLGAGDRGPGLKLEPGAPPTARLTSSSDEIMGSFPMYRHLQVRLWAGLFAGASGSPAPLAYGHGHLVVHLR